MQIKAVGAAKAGLIATSVAKATLNTKFEPGDVVQIKGEVIRCCSNRVIVATTDQYGLNQITTHFAQDLTLVRRAEETKRT